MENRLESRIQILDKLSKKWGEKDGIVNFKEFCEYYNSDAILQLVYLAMGEYDRQNTRSMYSKFEFEKLIEKYDSDLRNSTSHYQLPRKFTVEEWCKENL